MTQPKKPTPAELKKAAEAVEAKRLEDERHLARVERDRIDSLEMDQLDAHVNIANMTRDQMAAYAMRTYGVRVDSSALKADVTSSVRNLMMSRSGGVHA